MIEKETEIDPTAEVETIQETTTEVEIEITTIGIEVEIVETIVELEIEAEIDLIPEKEETNQDLDQVKDTLTGMNSAITAIHTCFKLENYLKRKVKKIVVHDDDDVQEIAQAVQHPNTKINSLKVSYSTNN